MPGFSWNPLTGCLGPDSKGVCPYCYARTVAETRLKGRHGYPEDEPFKPTFHADKLQEPLKRKKAAGIFVCDMADLFGRWVDKEIITAILETISKTPQHTYYMLTKNPARYMDFVEIWPDNAWAGTTIDKCTEYQRISMLREFKTHIKISSGKDIKIYISMEPMLTPMPDIRLGTMIDWLIIGGLSNSDHREPGYPMRFGEVPPKTEWVDAVLKDADGYGIPVFFKNNLKWSGIRRKEHPLIAHA